MGLLGVGLGVMAAGELPRALVAGAALAGIVAVSGLAVAVAVPPATIARWQHRLGGGRVAEFLGHAAEALAPLRSAGQVMRLLALSLVAWTLEGAMYAAVAISLKVAAAPFAPWLALAEDVGVVVRFVDVHEDLSLDLDDLAAQVTSRTRVVAFPAAANSVGTRPDVARVVELAHEAGALAWVDAVHYGPHGPIDVAAWGCDVLVCSPYKFFGPHLGLAFGREELLRSLRPYKVRPAADEPVGSRFELGTSQHELLAGFIAAVDYVDSLGWEAIVAHETALGVRFLEGLPPGVTLHGLPTMEGRVPTFCFTVPGRSARSVAEHLAARDVAVWWGNYYALETMRYLGLDEDDGAVRAGIVHYNTADEVDRTLAALDAIVRR